MIAFPDLEPEFETATVSEGRATLAVSVRNNDLGNSGAFALGIYVSATPELTAESRLFARGNVSGLRSRTSIRLSGTVSLPSDLAPGDYFLIAVADYLGAVTESRETNNAVAAPVTVGTGTLGARSTAPAGATGDFALATDVSVLSLAPNPASDVLTLRLHRSIVATAVAELVDASGRVVLRQPLPAAADATAVALDVSALADGVYAVVVTEAGRTTTARVVVRR